MIPTGKFLRRAVREGGGGYEKEPTEFGRLLSNTLLSLGEGMIEWIFFLLVVILLILLGVKF